jgi:hypothetical protein
MLAVDAAKRAEACAAARDAAMTGAAEALAAANEVTAARRAAHAAVRDGPDSPPMIGAELSAVEDTLGAPAEWPSMPSDQELAHADAPKPTGKASSLEESLDRLAEARAGNGEQREASRASEHRAAAEVARAQAAGLTASYSKLITTPPPDVQPEHSDPGAPMALARALKALSAARARAAEHAGLRVTLAAQWRNECAGCRASKAELGGAAESAAALLATNSASLYSGALASLRVRAAAEDGNALRWERQAEAAEEGRRAAVAAAKQLVANARSADTRTRARLSVRVWQAHVSLSARADGLRNRLPAARASLAIAAEALAQAEASEACANVAVGAAREALASAREAAASAAPAAAPLQKAEAAVHEADAAVLSADKEAESASCAIPPLEGGYAQAKSALRAAEDARRATADAAASAESEESAATVRARGARTALGAARNAASTIAAEVSRRNRAAVRVEEAERAAAIAGREARRLQELVALRDQEADQAADQLREAGASLVQGQSRLAKAAAERHAAAAVLSAHVEAAGEAEESDRATATCAAYRKILHPKNGVGARLLRAAVAGVAAEVGAALKAMDASFAIEFGQDCALELVDGASGTRVPPALGSGYQQFVAALAVRWALAKVARGPLPTCLMIDEGFGCLDDDNLPRVAEALGALALRAPAGGRRPLVLAVTHREDMAPYFAERLGIQVVPAADGVAATSRVTYPPGAAADLDGVARHVARALPMRRCEACAQDVAAASWAAHERSARHAAAAAQGPPPADFYCRECERELAPGRWAKHGQTAAHAKAAAARADRDAVVAEYPAVTAPAPGRKVSCLVCPGDPVFTAKRWARHVSSAKHRANL